MKMAKKFGAMLLAASMMISGSAVFAAIEDPTAGEAASQAGAATSEGVTVTATGTAVGATIDINMPTSMDFIINPYGLEGKKQIISPELTIENCGDTDVQVTLNNLTAEITTGANGTAATLATALVDPAKSTKKEIFLFLQPQDAEGNYAEFNSKTDAAKVVKASGFKAVALDKLAKPVSEDADGGKLTMKLMGNANGNATWTADDKVVVTPVFTFAPCVIPASTNN